MTSLLRLLGVVSALFIAVPAFAQAAPDLAAAERLIQHGIASRKQGDDRLALEYFVQAAALDRSPRAVAQIGLAEYGLGLWVDAEAHLGEALATDDPWVMKHRATLEKAATDVSGRLGTLEITTNVEGAELLVDGQARGSLPLARPLRLATGTYSIELRRSGFYEASRLVRISARQTSRETIALEARSEPHATPVAARPPRAARTAPVEPKSERLPSNVETRFGTLKWIAAGSSAALLAAAGTMTLIREGQVSSYNEDSTCPGTARANQPETCDDRIARANTLETLSISALIGGLLLGAVSGGLFLTDEPRRSEVACSSAPRGIGIACQGRFW